MIDRLRNDQYAVIIAQAFAGSVEFDALDENEQEIMLDNAMNAIEALERRGHGIGPLTAFADNDP